VFDETNGSQEEQVHLDLVDDEEAPCDALQRMAIGNVRPQDPNEQLEDHSPSDTTPPTQGLDQDHEEKQDEHVDEDEHHNQKSKRRAMIKGKMRMMGIKLKAIQDLQCHIQEWVTPYKEITT
jgi:hypothetical protein